MSTYIILATLAASNIVTLILGYLCYHRLNAAARRLHLQSDLDRQKIRRLHERFNEANSRVYDIERHVSIVRSDDTPNYLRRQAS